MNTRSNKYQDNNSMSRVSRNEKVYEELNNEELDNFTIKSNATVIGNQEDEIDIEKLKKILDTRYNKAPKRKSIHLEEESEEKERPVEKTKEYDLNLVLEKAKDGKEESYEEARAKKLRDTQFDILSNLNIEDDDEPNQKEDDAELMNLINTISINETKVKKDDDAGKDLFEELKSNDEEDECQGIRDEIEKIEKTSKVIDNSLYTEKNVFKDTDFEENDFDNKEDNKMSIGLRIVIIILVIAFIIGLAIFIKSYFK